MPFPKPQVVDLERIRAALDKPAVFAAVKEALIVHSRGGIESPLPGHLLFPDSPGDCHIKYGYARHSDYFVIKIATGFYNNEAAGLPTNNGLNLVFSKKTGACLYLLLDEGWLTSWRTAAAGALTAAHFASPALQTIAMIGTGHQAFLQLEWFKALQACRNVKVWGRAFKKAENLCKKLRAIGYEATPCGKAKEAVAGSQLLFTTTASEQPLVEAGWLDPGTVIVAIGADHPGKKELETAVFKKAARVFADDIRQCMTFGEISYAAREGILAAADVVSIGTAFEKNIRPRGDETVIADLTGIPAEDIAISEAVLRAF